MDETCHILPINEIFSLISTSLLFACGDSDKQDLNSSSNDGSQPSSETSTEPSGETSLEPSEEVAQNRLVVQSHLRK